MLGKKMLQALNEQINAELYSAYLYLAMAAYFQELGMTGFANWMLVQQQEETAHAMRFYHYCGERSGKVVLKPIDGPPTSWDSPLHVFEETLKHEQHVSSLIHGLVDLARAEKDHATENMLAWFVSEQVEEEGAAQQLIDELKLLGGEKSGLFIINRELAARVYTPPAAGPA